jgi:hypothetical protein
MVQDESLSVAIHPVTCLFPGTPTQALVVITVIITSTTVITDTVSDRITTTTTTKQTLQRCSNGQ